MRGVRVSLIVGVPLVWALSHLGSTPGLVGAILVAVMGAIFLAQENARAEALERARSEAEAATTSLRAKTAAMAAQAERDLLDERQRIDEWKQRAVKLEALLEEARSSRASFLATVSHELRTPLHAIIGFNELVSDGSAGPVNATQREYLGDASAAAQHLMTLISDVLDYARSDAGRLTFAADQVHVGPVMAEVSALVEGLASKKDLKLTHSCDDGLTLVGDPLRVKQVLLNLVANAVKFTPRRGTVELMARAAGSVCELTVRDSGPGIAPEEQARIFEPFHQADSSRARRHSGTGLGLALVKRWAEAMGGCVELDSQPGVGTSFTVSLPLKVKAGVLKRVEPGDRIDVLVAEDDDATRLMLSRVLQAQGCEVRQAANGQRALEAIMASLPSVLLLDLMMPELDGYDLLKKLRSLPNGDRVRVLVFSATGPTPDLRESLLRFGAEVLLKGALSSSELVQRVRAISEETRRAA
jgi:signal transduction histidine kinase